MIIRGKMPGTDEALDITIKGKGITRIEPGQKGRPYDAGGEDLYVCRGFFDLQVNGYGGIDFNGKDLTPEKLHHASLSLASAGVTGFFPTLTTAPYERTIANLKILAQSVQGETRAGALADLVLFEHKEEVIIQATWIRGEKIWERG
jgi:N-acetylglucosamine-6-phosphate deacetylase